MRGSGYDSDGELLFLSWADERGNRDILFKRCRGKIYCVDDTASVVQDYQVISALLMGAHVRQRMPVFLPPGGVNRNFFFFYEPHVISRTDEDWYCCLYRYYAFLVLLYRIIRCHVCDTSRGVQKAPIRIANVAISCMGVSFVFVDPSFSCSRPNDSSRKQTVVEDKNDCIPSHHPSPTPMPSRVTHFHPVPVPPGPILPSTYAGFRL